MTCPADSLRRAASSGVRLCAGTASRCSTPRRSRVNTLSARGGHSFGAGWTRVAAAHCRETVARDRADCVLRSPGATGRPRRRVAHPEPGLLPGHLGHEFHTSQGPGCRAGLGVPRPVWRRWIAPQLKLRPPPGPLPSPAHQLVVRLRGEFLARSDRRGRHVGSAARRCCCRSFFVRLVNEHARSNELLMKPLRDSGKEAAGPEGPAAISLQL